MRFVTFVTSNCLQHNYRFHTFVTDFNINLLNHKSMRKLIIAALLLIGSANVTYAYQGIDLPAITLQARIKKPLTNGLPFPKNPITIPEVYLDDHTLYIENIGDAATIELTDGNGIVVYSAYVSASTTAVILPSTLSGVYDLRIIPDTGIYEFYGVVNL